MISSLVLIVKFINIYEGRIKTYIDKSEKEILEFWNFHWSNPNLVENFLYETFYNKTPLTIDRLAYMRVYFKEAYDEIFSHLEKQVFERFQTNINIPYYKLKRDEILTVSNIRELYSNNYGNEFKILNDTSDLIEDKMRSVFRNHFVLLFGDMKQRLIRYGTLKGKLEKKGINYSDLFFNELENINRGEYKDLMIQNTFLRENYFKKIFKKLTWNEIEDYISHFCQINVDTKHRTFKRIENYSQSQTYNFVLESINILEEINLSYLKLMKEHFFYKIKNSEEKTQVECYFNPTTKASNTNENNISSNHSIKNLNEFNKIELESNEIKTVKDKLIFYIETDEKYIIDLDNYENIVNSFGLEYEKFIAILALINLTNLGEHSIEVNIEPYHGSEIIIRKNKNN